MLQTYEPPRGTSLLYNPPSSTLSPTSKSNIVMSKPAHHNILIVTGPAGSGKSTVAKYLADYYGFTYIEGDEFHPQVNLDKMSAGIPLDDADRWDWLILLRDEALAAVKQGAKGVVVTCSALKKKYRDVIRTAKFYDAEDPEASMYFIYLQASKELLLARVAARQGHYMKDTMVISQLDALEPPDEYERQKDVLSVDVTGTMAEVQQAAVQLVNQVLPSV